MHESPNFCSKENLVATETSGPFPLLRNLRTTSGEGMENLLSGTPVYEGFFNFLFYK